MSPNGLCGVNKRLRTRHDALLSDCTDAYGGLLALVEHQCGTEQLIELASIDTLAFEQFWL